MKNEYIEFFNIGIYYRAIKIQAIAFDELLANQHYLLFILFYLSFLSFINFYNTHSKFFCQAPLSVGFSRQEYWSGLPFPSAGMCVL